MFKIRTLLDAERDARARGLVYTMGILNTCWSGASLNFTMTSGDTNVRLRTFFRRACSTIAGVRVSTIGTASRQQELVMEKLQSRIFTVCLAAVLVPLTILPAQQTHASPSAQTRTQAIAASFSKDKHVVKEKRGVRVEKYKRVVSEPVVKANPRDYSGTYEAPDMGLAVQLRVDRNGGGEGTGYEPSGPDFPARRGFTLRKGEVQGAL